MKKFVPVFLAILAAGIRLISLRAVPIFGDEAIYLRLARIVFSAPTEHLWIPLKIPNAPLHVWLLALGLPVSTDPLVAGRLLSVLFGVLLVLVLAGAVYRIGRAFGGQREDAFFVAALAAASPFLVFSDRIARPDSLFLLETALAVWLSVSIATRTRPLAAAVAFGVLMGLTMLTRQAVSYPLWLLPPIAFVLTGQRDWRRILLPLALAFAIATALWAPMLIAPGWPSLSDRIFHLGATRPALPPGERAALFGRNLGVAVAAFRTYLTPPVFLAAVAGFVLLAATRRRLFTFLASWEVLLLAPAALFAVDYFPRYALPAALPLFAAAAIAVSFAWNRWPRPMGVALAVVLLAWPAVEVARGLQSWQRWRLLPIDRQQFVSGWSAGLASERAVAFLEERAREGPIAVIVPRVSGNPSDAVWLSLDGVKNVRLFYAEDFLAKPALEVRGDVWTDAPTTAVDSDLAAYFVSQDPAFLGREGWAPAVRVVEPLNPVALVVAHFENLPNERGHVESAVAVYRLR
jgi:4-amino-4-deoxy-L-arabinose transferase-like glycosyltransferase